jgi:CheY-like chemotaxis protein
MVTWKTDVDTIPLHTVLIVSDQPENVAIWDTLFSQRNCIVLSESNISNALQSARLIGPSLMLVDMNVSRSDRAVLLNGLRATSRGPIPAVLVVKAMAWLGHGQRSERAPAILGVTL